MPTESLGIDSKLSGVDMDPKTYSPMSGSDENMSSPPSVLTTASAGSCTPSSLPSAGSTPSSIQSAGSTPYQFVSQEESTIIKPLTPSDQQSLPPSTPDQPITPEPSGHSVSSESQSGHIPDLGNCKKNILSGIENTECIIHTNHHRSPGISDDVNERRDDCSCIMCNDKQATSLENLSCKDNKETEDKDPLSIASTECNTTDTESVKMKKKVKLPKIKEPNLGKVRKRNKQPKTKAVHYQSEITGDPESTSIKIKIKLTPTNSSSKQKSYFSHSVSSTLDSQNLKKVHQRSKSAKRSLNTTNNSSKSSPSGEVRKRKKSKIIEPFIDWGPPLSEVDGEAQSRWAYDNCADILEKIFSYVTYTEGCIPFLHRVSKVCRLWRSVAVRPSLWHTINLSSTFIKPRHRTEKKLIWIIDNRLSKVEELYLNDWTEAVTPIVLGKISKQCPKLRILGISSCYKLHAENLHQLLLHSKNLEHLDLTNIMGAHKPTPRCAVGQQTLSDLTAFLNSKLVHLSLADNTLSNVPSILSSLANNCHNLQVLDLSSIETIGRDSVRIDIEKLQIGCPRLRVLRMANSLFRLCQTSMAAQASSPGFPDLEELSLAVDSRDNIGMNDGELERILKNSNKLRLLDVRGCHNITDSSLIRIPPWDIEHLFLAGGSIPRLYSDRLELVVRKWHHSLRELDLSWTGSSDAVDTAILALAEEESQTLRVVNLCGSSVTFESVKKLLMKCTNLNWLNLTSCRAMPRGVKRLYDNVILINQLKTSIKDGKYDEPPPEDD